MDDQSRAINVVNQLIRMEIFTAQHLNNYTNYVKCITSEYRKKTQSNPLYMVTVQNTGIGHVSFTFIHYTPLCMLHII